VTGEKHKEKEKAEKQKDYSNTIVGFRVDLRTHAWHFACGLALAKSVTNVEHPILGESLAASNHHPQFAQSAPTSYTSIRNFQPL
jgi:hypothetical protein